VVFVFFAAPAWDNSDWLISGTDIFVLWTILVSCAWPLGLVVLWLCQALFAQLQRLTHRPAQHPPSTQLVE
jgi:hypothetical protein